MRLDPRDPIFLQSPLDLIHKYYIENAIQDYRIYTDRLTNQFCAAAPAPVLLSNRARIKDQSFFLRNAEIRARKLTLIAAIDGEEREISGESFGDFLREGENRIAIAQDDLLLQEEYPRQAGLFSYRPDRAKMDIQYRPDFGHGEHVQYFIASTGTPFGVFSPGSFVFIDGVNRHRSQMIYDELLQSKIISRGGMVLDAPRLAGYDFLTPLTDYQAADLKNMLLHPAGLPALEKRYATLLTHEKSEIARDLSGALPHLRAEQLEAHLASMRQDERKTLFAFFVSRVVSSLLADQIVRYRGILRDNAKREILILLYEPVHSSSHYYGRLLDFFAKEKPGYNLRLAMAYKRPPPRRRENLLHPFVEALRDLENKKYIESAEPLIPDDSSPRD